MNYTLNELEIPVITYNCSDLGFRKKL